MGNEIKNIIETAKNFAEKAISLEFYKISTLNIPNKTSGVYIIKHNKDGIIYIGKAKDLRRRICTDHLSAETRDTMSAFRRSVNEQYKKSFGKEIKKWITQNCSFSYLPIPDHDMYSLAEAVLIASLRTPNLLNKPRIL